MIYANARLVSPDGVGDEGWIAVEDGRFSALGTGDPAWANMEGVVDCRGLYLGPGFIDLHTHGAGGHDFMDGTEEAFITACQTHMWHGTTTLLPTTLTCPDEELFQVIDMFRKVQTMRVDLPNLPGLHLEGPYFSVEQKGAQDERYLCNPIPEHYRMILEKAEGCIARWSVAPELPGAIKMGKMLSDEGILMSIGHSDCTYSVALEAVYNGYIHLTHFYSGMSGMKRVQGKRLLGLIECGYLMDELTLEIIADGMHLPPELLRLIAKCKNHEKICLVTDSMRAAGMPDGRSVLGSLRHGQEVIVEDGVAKLPDGSAYAGSVATADRLVRVMVQEAGLPLHEAVKMITLNPAHVAGLDKHKGSLSVGKDADFVLFDKDINIDSVYIHGRRQI